jgi:hypothetical protein
VNEPKSIASPARGLISRFLDPDPEFIYVPADQVLAEAAVREATPYDVAGVELGRATAQVRARR